MKKLFLLLFLIIPVHAQMGDINNRYLLAQSYEQAGEIKKAKEIYEELFRIQPQNPSFFSSLNNALVALKDFDKSIELLNQRIKTYPQEINLYGMLGCSYFLSGNEKEAGDIWLNTAKSLSKNESSFRVIANYALSVRAFDYAINLFKEAKNFYNNLALNYDLANLLMITMNYKDAAEEYAEIISKDPNQIYSVEARLQPYLAKEDVVKIYTEVLEQKNPDLNMNFAYLLIILYTQSSKFDKAFDLVKILDEKQKRQGTDLFNFAQKVHQAGNNQLSLSVYEFILNTHPKSNIIPSVKLNYAKTLEAALEEQFIAQNAVWKPIFFNKVTESNRYLELIDLYNEIGSLFPHSESAIEAKLRIGFIYLYRLNNLETAQLFFEEIRKNYIMSRFSADAIIALGKISLLNNNLDKAEHFFSELNNSSNNSLAEKNSAKYYSAQCLFFKNMFDSAKTLLSEISSDGKDILTNDALELMMIINSSMNDSLNLSKLSEAEFSLLKKDYTHSLTLLREIASNTQSFLLKDFSNLRTAEILTAMDKYSEALDLLSLSVNENDTNIYGDQILFFSGEINEYGLANFEAAIKNFENILINFPNSIYLEKCREKIQNLRSKLS